MKIDSNNVKAIASQFNAKIKKTRGRGFGSKRIFNLGAGKDNSAGTITISQFIKKVEDLAVKGDLNENQMESLGKIFQEMKGNIKPSQSPGIWSVVKGVFNRHFKKKILTTTLKTTDANRLDKAAKELACKANKLKEEKANANELKEEKANKGALQKKVENSPAKPTEIIPSTTRPDNTGQYTSRKGITYPKPKYSHFQGSKKSYLSGVFDQVQMTIDRSTNAEIEYTGVVGCGDCVGFMCWDPVSKTVSFQHSKNPSNRATLYMMARFASKSASNQKERTRLETFAQKIQAKDSEVSEAEACAELKKEEVMKRCKIVLVNDAHKEENLDCFLDPLARITEQPIYMDTATNCAAINRETGDIYKDFKKPDMFGGILTLTEGE